MIIHLFDKQAHHSSCVCKVAGRHLIAMIMLLKQIKPNREEFQWSFVHFRDVCLFAELEKLLLPIWTNNNYNYFITVKRYGILKVFKLQECLND